MTEILKIHFAFHFAFVLHSDVTFCISAFYDTRYDWLKIGPEAICHAGLTAFYHIFESRLSLFRLLSNGAVQQVL